MENSLSILCALLSSASLCALMSSLINSIISSSLSLFLLAHCLPSPSGCPPLRLALECPQGWRPLGQEVLWRPLTQHLVHKDKPGPSSSSGLFTDSLS
ncbi:hypothetical protein CHARACLAT_024928 [Characodon lateralis]|uniref:Secreted protein n=1 Tax=Characodon lateralis TaxID=208331 RepID=A0ABU7F6T9_9TELE|nr:hypothetical protein [Characodon lateralis]